MHKRISHGTRLRGGAGGPGTQHPSLISKGELAEAREHIPTMPDGKKLCTKRATHDDCDRDPCCFSHAELPSMMSSPEAIICLPCVVQMMGIACGRAVVGLRSRRGATIANSAKRDGSGMRMEVGNPACASLIWVSRGTTNPNPKVRKSGAVGKTVLAQGPGFVDGSKSCCF